MKSSMIENLLKDHINNGNDMVPFYKKKIFFIFVGAIIIAINNYSYNYNCSDIKFKYFFFKGRFQRIHYL